jgi:hypothetical protein
MATTIGGADACGGGASATGGDVRGEASPIGRSHHNRPIKTATITLAKPAATGGRASPRQTAHQDSHQAARLPGAEPASCGAGTAGRG